MQVKTMAPHQMAAENLQNGAAAAAGNVKALLRAGSSPVCSVPLYGWDLHKDFVFSSYSPDTT